MNTIWINLTNLRNWGRIHLTGIQRVLYEILQESIHRNDIKFFYFDKMSAAKFIELNALELQLILNKDKEQSNHQNLNLNKPEENIAVQAPSRLYQSVAKFIPEKILKMIPQSLLKLSSKIVRKCIHTLRLIKGAKASENNIEILEETIVNIFEKGDTVCLFGGCWGVPQLMESIAIQKEEKNLKIITLIYDLIPIRYPQFCLLGVDKSFQEYIHYAVQISHKILSISENTKKDIETECKKADLPIPPIVVVKLGDDAIFKENANSKITYKKPYILCVGSIEVRKNHILIYQAYKYLIQKYGAVAQLPDMLIVGGKAWLSDDIYFQIQHDPEINTKIRFIENLGDGELLSLYKNCLFTVYPSIYEGWGLPIAESLRCGKFCLSSRTSSMPEIAGDLIEYFSPYDSAQLAELIWDYSRNPEKLKAKEIKLMNEFKVTNWQTSADAILRECYTI